MLNMFIYLFIIIFFSCFQDRANTEMKLLKELSEANEKNISFETKVKADFRLACVN